MLKPSLRFGLLALSAPFLLGLHSPLEPAAPAHPSAAPMQLLLLEEFHAVGAEPTFWTAQVKSDFDRVERGGAVEFQFELRQFEAVLGQEEELRFIVERGVDRLVLGQNPSTQELSAPGEATIVDFVNDIVDQLDGTTRSGAWTERLRLADDNVIPGLSAVDVEVEFTSEPLVVEDTVYTLLQFRSSAVRFEAVGSDVDVTYRGMGIVDAEKSLVYHAVFQQSGSVDTNGATTQLNHVSLLSLLDAGDEPLLALEDNVLELMNRYVFRPRPAGNVNPEVQDENIKPDWATGVWIAGHIGGTVLGLVAEQSTNPMPVTSLGSLVLADQAIGYAGNLYVDHLDVEAGRKSEDQVNPHDREFLSPIENTYARATSSTRMGERLSLVGPETTGSLSIGGKIFGIGVATATAIAIFESAGASSLGFASAGSATAAGSAAAGAGAVSAATGLSLTTIGLGVAGAGGVAVAASSGGGGSSGPPPDVVLNPVAPAPFEDVIVTVSLPIPGDPPFDPVNVTMTVTGSDGFFSEQTLATNNLGEVTFPPIPGAEVGVRDDIVISAPGFSSATDTFTY